MTVNSSQQAALHRMLDHANHELTCTSSPSTTESSSTIFAGTSSFWKSCFTCEQYGHLQRGRVTILSLLDPSTHIHKR
jgi:hypothetical protein